MKYTLSKVFTMRAEVTDRTLAVSEAFGVPLDDEQTYTVYENLELEIFPGDVVYILGDSGSGKSLLLKALKEGTTRAVSTSDLEIAPDTTLVEGVGCDFNEAVRLLTLVGLNDAFLFLRKYRELSDGQKYRYQLAKMLDTDAEYYFIDEFCTLLDRDTAKVVSYNMQRVTRKFGKTLIVATPHSDLQDDLYPSLVVRKGQEKEVTVSYPPKQVGECSLLAELELVEGTPADYWKLARFHYRNSKVTSPQRIYKLINGSDLVGVIVYTYPLLASAGRNAFTDRYRAATSEVAKLLNEEVSLISRVIIHPKYRGIGLGAKLIASTLPLTGKRYVEMLTTMGAFNPFAEKAGMVRVDYTPYDQYKVLRNRLQLLGWDLKLANSRHYNLEMLSRLDQATYEDVALKIIKKVRHLKGGGLKSTGSTAKKSKDLTVDDFSITQVAEMIKEVLPRDRVYYVWENPKWHITSNFL